MRIRRHLCAVKLNALTGVTQGCGVEMVWARCKQLCLISITMATSKSMEKMLSHVISTFKWQRIMI